ncbi:MAG: methyltransferase [Proteobacteria bacterium]|nr:methyltransferase [Pseudomonadota bacterium]
MSTAALSTIDTPGLVNVNVDETVEMLGTCLLVQKRDGHRLTTDALLLSDFAAETLAVSLPCAVPSSTAITTSTATPVSSASPDSEDNRGEFTLEPEAETRGYVEAPVVDIGTGNGAIGIMLARRTLLGNIVGVELQSELAELAERNVGANKLKERISIMGCDYRELPLKFKAGSCALVISNPPYIKAGSGRPAENESRRVARSEVYGTLANLVGVTSYLIGDRGRACFIYPVIRYGEMLDELKRAELKVRRIRFIHTTPEGDAVRFLIEIGRTGNHVTEDPIFL